MCRAVERLRDGEGREADGEWAFGDKNYESHRHPAVAFV